MKDDNKNSFKYYLKKSYKTIIIVAVFLLLTYWARLISDSFSIDTELYIQEYTHSFDWWLNLERWGLVFLNKILKIGPLIIPHANFLTVLFIFVYSILYCYLLNFLNKLISSSITSKLPFSKSLETQEYKWFSRIWFDKLFVAFSTAES